MSKFRLDLNKSINASLFVIKELGGTSNFHQVFKILYFADQKHLARYGRPITGDWYVAMKNGPVPSNLYDIFKALKSDSLFNQYSANFKDIFETKFYFVKAKQEPNLDYLSQSEIDVLKESLNENNSLTFDQLTDKSHDSAYSEAFQDDAISFHEIAKAGGANETMLQYIELNIENQRL